MASLKRPGKVHGLQSKGTLQSYKPKASAMGTAIQKATRPSSGITVKKGIMASQGIRYKIKTRRKKLS